MPEMDVNYSAVLTAALISFILGIFWYSPLIFGRQWLAAQKKSAQDIKKTARLSMYLISFAAWLIASYVLANIVNFSGANTLGNGLVIGFLCWFGFTAAFSLMNNSSEGKPVALWLINAGYILAGMLLSGAIFGVWK